MGEYVYIQMRNIAGRHFTIHLDFDVAERSIMERISLGNMYKEPKANARSMLVPLQIPMDTWTTVCVCVPEILAMFKRAMPNAHNLRKLQVCASCVVRNIFTSESAMMSRRDEWQQNTVSASIIRGT